MGHPAQFIPQTPRPTIKRGLMQLPDNPNDDLSFDSSELRTIVLAGGCFWGSQAYLRRLPGVARTTVGYANGQTPDPSYEQVCSNTTGHAEAVRVEYAAERLSLAQLLVWYFQSIDPTSLNRQGNDRGRQYRTGIYYSDPSDEPIIRQVIQAEQRKYAQPLVTEILPLICFYPAEDYHQDYLEKNPQGYCHLNISQLISGINDD